MGSMVTFIPTVYTAGIGTEHKNLIHQSLSITLEECQGAAHARFATVSGTMIPLTLEQVHPTRSSSTTE